MKSLPLNNGRGYALSIVILFSTVGILSQASFASWRRPLAASPTSLSFGNVAVGSSQSKYETLTNSTSSGITLYSTSISGTGFSASGLSLPMTLSPGQSVTFSLRFTPQSSGSVSGSLSIKTKYWRYGISVPLSGTGTSSGQLSVAPGSLNFGNVTVGSSSTLSSNLSASGGSVTLSSVTTTSSEFSLSGFSLPLTITAGQSVPFTVNFAPKSSGAASGTLAFASTSNSANEGVSGTGVAPSHSVTLSWSDSSSGLSGYNIYRAGSSGGPYARVNSSLNPTTGYVDTSVVAGKIYYYVATAVDTSGVESPYSNQVQAVIPSP